MNAIDPESKQKSDEAVYCNLLATTQAEIIDNLFEDLEEITPDDGDSITNWLGSLQTSGSGVTSALSTENSARSGRNSTNTTALNNLKTVLAAERSTAEAAADRLYRNTEQSAWNSYLTSVQSANTVYLGSIKNAENTYKTAVDTADTAYRAASVTAYTNYHQSIHALDTAFYAAVTEADDPTFTTTAYFTTTSANPNLSFQKTTLAYTAKTATVPPTSYDDVIEVRQAYVNDNGSNISGTWYQGVNYDRLWYAPWVRANATYGPSFFVPDTPPDLSNIDVIVDEYVYKRIGGLAGLGGMIENGLYVAKTFVPGMGWFELAIGEDAVTGEPLTKTDVLLTIAGSPVVAGTAATAIGKAWKLAHKASSGVKLVTTLGKTTTILGNYDEDIQFIIKELRLVPTPADTRFVSMSNPNGFNVLNVGVNIGEGVGKIPRDEFWKLYNKPFLDAAVARGDEIIMASRIMKENIFLNASNTKSINFFTEQGIQQFLSVDPRLLKGFGREYQYLLQLGYRYNPSTHKMVHR